MELVIRKAKKGDFPQIRALIKELSDFEKMDGPKISAEDLERDYFDEVNPSFYCFVCEEKGMNSIVGYTIYHFGFTVRSGRIIYIEDIYVMETHRKRKIGVRLFARVCQEAIERNCNSISFSVLDWNPATEFYKSLGAEDKFNSKWTTYKLSKETIDKLVELC